MIVLIEILYTLLVIIITVTLTMAIIKAIYFVSG